MKVLSRNFVLLIRRRLTVAIFFCSFILLAPQYVSAQVAINKTNDNNRVDVSMQIEENLEKFVIPMSNSLLYSLTKTLPKIDGRRLPLSISITPTDPENPEGTFQVVYYCPWGYEVCAPFFSKRLIYHL